MSKKILVVVDMQKDFVDGALGTKEAVDITPNVVKKINEFDGDIFVTLDTHSENYLDTQEGHNLPVVHCVKNTEGWKLDKAVDEAIENAKGRGINVKVFEKPTFGSSKLGNALGEINAKDGISEITFIGLCTGICVISNVMIAKAFMPEVPITVDSRCCACVTPDSHKTALEAMKLCQIKIEE